MYRVLIVDDERLIREGVRSLVNWADLGYEVMALAADGAEALEVLSQHRADLILVDIRMPGMGGLEFLQALRDRGDEARVLVLSGFAEFEYAQKAAALRVDGYLLKPVDEDELCGHLERLRRHLDGHRFTARTLLSGVDRVPPEWDWGRWQVLSLVRVSASGQDLDLDTTAAGALRDACRRSGWGEVFTDGAEVGLILRQVFPGGRNLDRLARALDPLVGQGCLWTGLVGPVATSAAEVALTAAQVRRGLERRFFLTPGTLSLVGDPPDPGEPPLEALAERLTLALEAGDRSALDEAVAQTLTALTALGTEAAVKEAVSRLTVAALERVAGGEARGPGRHRDRSWIADVWKQPFLGQLRAFLVDRLEHEVAADRSPDSTNLVERMVDLIENRYAENLKLETLAEVFHYNSGYLGKVFRAKTGEYFNTYLDRVRIRHAQNLLKQGLKVYQVAEAVGYRYVDYFHAKYKKYTGESPRQTKAHESGADRASGSSVSPPQDRD